MSGADLDLHSTLLAFAFKLSFLACVNVGSNKKLCLSFPRFGDPWEGKRRALD